MVNGKVTIDGVDYGLKPCPFCGCSVDLQMLNEASFLDLECATTCEIGQKRDWSGLLHSWFINCPDCSACGPEIYIGEYNWVETDEDCQREAVRAWNKGVRRDGKGDDI